MYKIISPTDTLNKISQEIFGKDYTQLTKMYQIKIVIAEALKTRNDE